MTLCESGVNPRWSDPDKKDVALPSPLSPERDVFLKGAMLIFTCMLKKEDGSTTIEMGFIAMIGSQHGRGQVAASDHRGKMGMVTLKGNRVREIIRIA